jgi:PTH1 family peptidyl-tRNA hydrolase
VQPAVAFFRLPVDSLLVVCDDFNLPLAKLRFRAKGSAGGQKGLADIIRCLATEEFARLRVGIGLPDENRDAVDHVLSRFRGAEAAEIQRATLQAADAVMDWVRWGIDECMNVYN